MDNGQILKSIENGQKSGFLARFLIGSLATWRLTELFLDEAAPFGLAEKLRNYAATNAPNHPLIMELHKGLSCSWCLSVWLGWIVALLQKEKGWFLLGFAYSAMAISLLITRKGFEQWLVLLQRRF